MEVINILLPVFIIIALGTILRRTNFMSQEVALGLNRLVFWVGLPSLLFYEVATAKYDYHLAGKTFLVVLSA
ncbi:MAG: AEC family transporter, partial [Phycisphaerae bacterium]